MTFFVGFSGPIASGKTTAATMLRVTLQREGFNARIFSFAGSLREVASIAGMYGVCEEERFNILFALFRNMDYYTPELCRQAANMCVAYGNAFPNVPGEKNRRLLQLIGTEVGREILGENVWINALKTRVSPNVDFAIIDDVRFDNEAQMLDIHVNIVIGANAELYSKRLQELPEGYAFSAHKSEGALTEMPTLFIPVGFDELHIQEIVTLCENQLHVRW